MDEPLSGAAEPEPTPRWAWWTLGGIVLMGAFLRFFHLSKESFWFDELWTWKVSLQPPGEVVRLVARDVHLPAYFLLDYLAVRCLGDAEWALRLPAVIFGLAVVPMLFLLGRAFYSYREGLTAAACVAVLWWPVSSSRDARPYSMLMFVAALATWLLLRLLRHLEKGDGPAWKPALAYAAAAVLALYTHYFSWLLLVVHLCVMLPFFKVLRCRIVLVPVCVGVVASYLPWTIVLLDRIQLAAKGVVWIAPPVFMDLPAFFWYQFNHAPSLGLCALALYLWLLVDFLRERRKAPAGVAGSMLPPSGVHLALWIFGPLLALYLASYKTPMLKYRFLAFVTPAVYVLFARAIFRLPLPARARGWAAGLVCAGLLLHLHFGLDFMNRPWNAQYREAVTYVVENEPDSKGTVVGYLYGTDGAYYDYYFEKAGSPLRVAFGKYKSDVPNLRTFLSAGTPPRLWLIIGNGAPDMDQVNVLSEYMVAKQRIRFFETEVWLFVPRQP